MARRVKSCSPTLIRFKTKRGKTVTFKGRSGGQKKAGGNCANKARRKTSWMRKLGAAGKSCSRKGLKPGSAAMGKCVKAKLKAA